MNIFASIPNPNDATSFYRAIGPLSQLRKSLNINLIQKQEANWSNMQMCDLLFLQRPYLQEHIYLADRAAENSVPIWVDYDDDLLSVPKENPAYMTYSDEKIKANVTSLIQRASVLTVSTQKLFDKFIKLNKNTILIRNSIPDYLLKYRQSVSGSRKNICHWRGSRTHSHDIFKYKKQIEQFSEKHKHIQINFIGDNPWFIGTRFNCINPMEINSYFRYLFNTRASMAMVPLCIDDFNASKSNIAYLEMSLAGSVVVAPAMQEWMQAGCFCYDNEDHFLYQMNAVANMSETQIISYNELAFQNICDNFLLSKTNQKRIEILRNL